ncbi:MAG: hypothetical protein AB7L91_03590 [Dehalococcoidia bacterium]
MHPWHHIARGLAAAVLLAAALSTGGRTEAQSGPYTGTLPPPGGAALLVTSMSVAATDLASAVVDDGCTLRLMAVTGAGQWLIYIPGAPAVVNASFPGSLAGGAPFVVLCEAEPTPADAVAVVREYIADLDAARYDEAYAAWEPGQNPLTFEQFEAGYAHTVSVSVDIGEPGPVDAGAGQRYIEVPVVIHSTLDDGTKQTFDGTFTLHRTANIPGSTIEQRHWHIYSASIAQTS